jgi:hypothetical protein
MYTPESRIGDFDVNSRGNPFKRPKQDNDISLPSNSLNQAQNWIVAQSGRSKRVCLLNINCAHFIYAELDSVIVYKAVSEPTNR